MTTALIEQLQESLGKQYLLERELPGGAMSRVFLARERSLGRRIVVKILPPEMTAGVSLERFQREIQLAATLLHPHIVPLLNAGDADGLPYYTMPFVEGESLRIRLAREGWLPPSEALRLGREIALALDYAHRQQVVHRDIKPGNILLHDGHALVADFGIARAISQASQSKALTVFGMTLGTPTYMSPEQGSGDPHLDGRSDIYALGCVLYEMLTGEAPYAGGSARAIVLRHLTDPVPRPSAVRTELPPEVDELIQHAMAKDPQERFASGAELAQSLDRCDLKCRVAPTTTTRGTGLGADSPGVTETKGQLVAVLPFENLGTDREDDYFSDGITEEIIGQLSRIRGLKVISRTSVMKFKNVHRPAREIGRELGVSHLLGGSVRRLGNRVRIRAHLIDASTDEQMWAETYDREMTDIFAIESEVAEQLAARIQAPLSSGDHWRLFRKPTDHVEAYNQYLLGRHHYNKVTPEDFTQAMEHYREAIRLDPSFARAHAALAEALQYRGLGYWGIRPHDALPESFEHATTALTLDPLSAEAYAALGIYREWYEYDWDAGGSAFARAVELSPSAPMIRLYWAMHLAGVGRFDEAMEQRNIACQLDPSAMVIHGNASWVAYLVGRKHQALVEARTLRLLDPGSAYGAFSHGLVCAGESEHGEEAISAFRDAVRLSGGISLYVTMLAYALARHGEPAEARALLETVHSRTTEFVWPMGLAFAYAHLGEPDVALDFLERAYDERVGWMPLIGREPALDILRDRSRFQRLARRISPVAVRAAEGRLSRPSPSPP